MATRGNSRNFLGFFSEINLQFIQRCPNNAASEIEAEAEAETEIETGIGIGLQQEIETEAGIGAETEIAILTEAGIGINVAIGIELGNETKADTGNIPIVAILVAEETKASKRGKCLPAKPTCTHTEH